MSDEGVLAYGDPLENGYRLGDFPIPDEGVIARIMKYSLGGHECFTMSYFLEGTSEDFMKGHLILEARRIIANAIGWRNLTEIEGALDDSR